MELFGVSDLAKRWHYTSQGVRVLARSKEFPAPAGRISSGRVPVWELSAVEDYERTRPELHAESYKKRKQVGFYLAKQKGASRVQA